PELVEKHLSDDPAIREAVRDTLQAVFETRTMDEWLDEFDGVDTAVGGVYTVTEAFDHEQTTARGMVVESDGSPPRIGFPIHGADGSAVPTRLPDHGEHTASVLREAGVSDETIARLARDS
ncbi:CoA transferase, partial [Haladaptatus sp.]|uniref:CoA transferase n=1 Tax=Haladaptatus sp. TaxID=1973141 RepID=UPI003C43BBD8